VEADKLREHTQTLLKSEVAIDQLREYTVREWNSFGIPEKLLGRSDPSVGVARRLESRDQLTCGRKCLHARRELSWEANVSECVHRSRGKERMQQLHSQAMSPRHNTHTVSLPHTQQQSQPDGR
jgi:hypothetical protein